MGIFARGVAALLFTISFSLSSASATPLAKLQRHLPSQVKKVNIHRSAKARAQKKIAPVMVPDLKDSGLSPFDDKYVSKTVHFAASTAPVPEEYGCDSLIEEKQMRQAEQEAMAKCEGNAEKHCRLHQIKIVKSGELRCQEIPGRDCGVKKFYRGCVAQAIVVGEEEPEAQASVL